MESKVATNFNKRNMTNFITENTTPVNPAVEAPVKSKDLAKEYRIKLLENLIGHVKRRNEFDDKFYDLFGGRPGNSDTSPYRFVEDLFDDQIKLVAELIGGSKDDLEWFVYENKCGNRGYQAGIDGDMRNIRTVENYLWLVDLEQNKR